MSTSHVDISHDLIDGIFDVLSGNVVYSGVTYPVYKSIPKTPAAIYVHVHDVNDTEDGTKDAFIYQGTVTVEIVNEGLMRADMKLLQKINGVVRGLLKATKAGTFSIGGTLTLIVFKFNVGNTFIEPADNGIVRSRLINSYNFLIQ
jgi:hypothetical protein